MVRKKKSAEDRRTEIIDTTISVLAFEGYASVTMRSIADRIGVHLSTLQYYFPTKRDLLRSAIDKCIESDFLEQQRLAQDSTTEPGAQLRKVLAVHLHASADPMISKVFSTLWGIAAHDSGVEQLLNNFYQQQIELYAKLLKRNYPGWPAKKCVRRAILVVAQLEGLALFVAPGKPRLVDLKTLQTELFATVIPVDGSD
jgi:AcrR family transcriptional regulator